MNEIENLSESESAFDDVLNALELAEDIVANTANHSYVDGNTRYLAQVEIAKMILQQNRYYSYRDAYVYNNI